MEAFKEPLTKEEEELWLARYKAGEPLAKNVLIERNLRLVAHIAKKYSKNEYASEDLLSVGTIGLIKAVNTFDNSKGIRIGTYASKCIENEILMYLRGEKKISREVSLYEPIGTDKEGNVIHLLEVMICDGIDVVELCDIEEKMKWLYSHFARVLTHREQDIIAKRYGLVGGYEMTQKELAKELSISRSYVSRIEKRALEKLKEDFSKGNK